MAVPTPPSNLTATRVNDSRTTLSWTNNSTSSAPYTEINIYRGSASDTIYMLQDTVAYPATSWTDTSTQPDNSYKYVLDAYSRTSGASDFSNVSNVIYNTPAAPSSISGARVNGTVVRITLTNNSQTATSTELQYSTDKATWNDATSTQTKATTIDYDTGGGEFYFRARNARGDLKSAWITTDSKISALVPPSAPTLILPIGGAVVSKADENVVFTWKHNPVDGSEQTSAQLQYSTDGGSNWTTVQVSTEQSATVANNFTVNDTVTWRVRTKGADPSYGEYSENRTFVVYQIPSVSFVYNNPPITVGVMPIPYQITYLDQSGSLSSGTVSIVDANNNVVYSEDIASTLSGSISVSEFLPENGSSYSMVADVISTSSLSNSVTFPFSVAFVEPLSGFLSISNNNDGIANMVVSYEASSGIELTFEGNTVTTILNGLDNGTKIKTLEIKGKSFIWNQLVNQASPQGSISLTYGRYYYTKYRASSNPSVSMSQGGIYMPTNESIVIDLTAIYGEGYEPHTVAAFESSDAFVSMHESGSISKYDTGSVQTICGAGSVTGSSITWSSFNVTQSDGSSMSHTYSNVLGNTYLASTGTANDSVKFENGNATITRKIKCVDLGSLSWSKSGSTFSTEDVTDVLWTQNPLLCHAYVYGGNESSSEIVIHQNKHIYRKQTSSVQKADRLFVIDNSYQTAEAFKSAMSGVLMYYESSISTETITPISFLSLYAPTSNIKTNSCASGDVQIVTLKEFPQITHATLKRGDTVIADNIQSGTAVADKYAPINTDYAYTLITHAESGAIKAVDFQNRIVSPYWFFYWGNNQIAKAKWNPTGTTDISRPQRVRRRYDGKRFEQSYDGYGVSDVRNLSVSMLDEEQRKQFEKLMYESGHGVYKSGEGDVYEADIDYNRSIVFYQNVNKGEISLTITRTEGQAL